MDYHHQQHQQQQRHVENDDDDDISMSQMEQQPKQQEQQQEEQHNDDHDGADEEEELHHQYYHHHANNGGVVVVVEDDGLMKTNNNNTNNHNGNGMQQQQHHDHHTTTTTITTTKKKIIIENNNNNKKKKRNDFWSTLAGVIGNVLEWYDFAVFGYFSDVIGHVFFPSSSSVEDDNDNDDNDHRSTAEAFIIFGGAFLMRPIGGILLGYIGDTYGRKRALILSIFLMAFPTFFMGCLPTYNSIGIMSIVLLILVRLLQGLSVGGQLMSSLVYTLENQPHHVWGLYGSYVMAAANFGTLLGGVVGYIIRETLTQQQLYTYGWRIPFLMGIVVSISGFYLRYYAQDDHDHDDHDHDDENNNQNEHRHEHHYQENQRESTTLTKDGETSLSSSPSSTPPPPSSSSTSSSSLSTTTSTPTSSDEIISTTPTPTSTSSTNPLFIALSWNNLRPLLASSMVPMLWSAGFYLCFVWMTIYMSELIPSPIPHAFGINSITLFISVCLFFPVAGALSDKYPRKYVMTIGGISMMLLAPSLIAAIAKSGNPAVAFFSQILLGISVSLWGAPMCSWMVESFEPKARLTSVAIGYNIAQAIAGGTTPYLATVLVDNVSILAPGYILTTISLIGLTGIWCVAPPTTITTTIISSSIRDDGSNESCSTSTNGKEGRTRSGIVTDGIMKIRHSVSFTEIATTSYEDEDNNNGSGGVVEMVTSHNHHHDNNKILIASSAQNGRASAKQNVMVINNNNNDDDDDDGLL